MLSGIEQYAWSEGGKELATCAGIGRGKSGNTMPSMPAPLRGFEPLGNVEVKRSAVRHHGRMGAEPTWPVFCLDGDDIVVVCSAAGCPLPSTLFSSTSRSS